MAATPSIPTSFARAVAAATHGPEIAPLPKIEAVAAAIQRMAPTAREVLGIELLRGEYGAAGYVSTLEHLVNHSVDGRPKKKKYTLTPRDVVTAWRYAEAKRAASSVDQEALTRTLESGQVAKSQELLGAAGFDAGPAGLGFAARLFSARDGGSSLLQVRCERSLEGLSDALELAVVAAEQASSAKERDEARTRAGDLFAALVEFVALRPASSRTRLELLKLIDGMGTAGIPGCVPSRGQIHAELPGLGLKVTTRLDMPATVQAAALAWQLSPRGDDPSFYRPGAAEPDIKVAIDKKYLGSPDAPLGFLAKGGTHVVVPAEVTSNIIEHRKGPYGVQMDRLGFGEVPKEDFHLETQYYGAALKLPVEVPIGDSKLRLAHGRYIDQRTGEAAHPTKTDDLLTLTSGGSSVSINIKNGEVVGA